MDTDSFAPEKRDESAVPGVKKELERMIASGEIGAGERINESAIATKIGVSRGPIREACRLLERDGLLKSVMNRGFYVRTLSVKEALDLYELRITLFGMVGRLAAARITAEQIGVLAGLCDAMDTAAQAGEIVEFYGMNTLFHKNLVEIADNYKITEIWPGLENELQLFRRRGLTTTETMLSSNSEHRQILAALSSGNATQAARAMEQHIAEGRSRLLRSIGL